MTMPLGLFSKLVRMRLFLLATLVFSGCGYAQYESRLSETKKYWAYLDKIEQFLAPKWYAQEIQMELRVPNQFYLIPPPQRIQREDGTVEEPSVDPRQPDYLNLTFPELFGAWETPLTVLKTDGGQENRKGYLYAVCNYWQLVGEQASEAGQFLANLKTHMAEKLQVPPSDERVENQPSGYPAYQPISPFDVCDFKGIEIEGIRYNFTVYSKTSGSVIGVLILVLPEGMDAPQKISERIPLMLASFNLAKSPPTSLQTKNAPAAQQQSSPAKQGF